MTRLWLVHNLVFKNYKLWVILQDSTLTLRQSLYVVSPLARNFVAAFNVQQRKDAANWDVTCSIRPLLIVKSRDDKSETLRGLQQLCNTCMAVIVVDAVSFKF